MRMIFGLTAPSLLVSVALTACTGADAPDVAVNPNGPERIAELERATSGDTPEARDLEVIGDGPDYTRAATDDTGQDRYAVPTDTPPNEVPKYSQVGATECPRSQWLGVDDYDGTQAPATEFEAWLLEEDVPEGIVATDSGLRYRVIQSGIERGYTPQKFDDVVVHYHGLLADGTVFDSSYDRDEIISFKPAQVIPGWTEALMTMAPCEARTLYIPPQLAYGKRGSGPMIGPDTPLVFNVQMLGVKVP